jgi:hypothetical protein
MNIIKNQNNLIKNVHQKDKLLLANLKDNVIN